VQGEGGYVPPAPEFLQLLRKACDRSGALPIVDEVQAGAGRTGKMWSVEHSGVEPDMLTFGKGIGGDVPMAGLVMRADLAAKIPDGCAPNTFAANSVSAAVARVMPSLTIPRKLLFKALDIFGDGLRAL
jgi:4-aminobutyrate aminotransferase